jgi:hypothetical protein
MKFTKNLLLGAAIATGIFLVGNSIVEATWPNYACNSTVAPTPCPAGEVFVQAPYGQCTTTGDGEIFLCDALGFSCGPQLTAGCFAQCGIFHTAIRLPGSC